MYDMSFSPKYRYSYRRSVFRKNRCYKTHLPDPIKRAKFWRHAVAVLFKNASILRVLLEYISTSTPITTYEQNILKFCTTPHTSLSVKEATPSHAAQLRLHLERDSIIPNHCLLANRWPIRNISPFTGQGLDVIDFFQFP